MFITMPSIFADMKAGRLIGILFFLLVLFADLTSAIALVESSVSTFSDEFGWSRKKGTIIMGLIMISLGSLSCLGYGPLSFVTILGMPFLYFFDFLTNSVMMPVAAIAICVLVSRHMGVYMIEDEVMSGGKSFRRRNVFNFMIRWICPVFSLIILASSVASAFGWITI
jgi:NSS family neurotransmitter:Na+ symporter